MLFTEYTGCYKKTAQTQHSQIPRWEYKKKCPKRSISVLLFMTRWIGRGSLFLWQLRSPEFTPWNFFLWANQFPGIGVPRRWEYRNGLARLHSACTSTDTTLLR
ncbi:hypothetical protein TNCV_451461 [Trichonephila clavipes]|nr:hypothetical protein TNCV_451461 [Trichonephila clavipes]